MTDPWMEDENATRAATEALPTGYAILWDRDDNEQFCGDLYGPDGDNICGLSGERERVLRVLSESAREHAG
jgi:hypothetical protein